MQAVLLPFDRPQDALTDKTVFMLAANMSEMKKHKQSWAANFNLPPFYTNKNDCNMRVSTRRARLEKRR